MDRIAALRNVEDALADFEAGDCDLAAMEERVLGVLRTYATDFEDDDLGTYRAAGGDAADGVVVVAGDRAEARERVVALADASEESFDLERLG